MTTEEESEALHLRVSVGDITVEVEGPVDDAEVWFESLQEDYLDQIDDETLAAAANRSDVFTPGESQTQTSGSDTTESTSSSSGKSQSLPEYYKMVDNPTKKDSALLVGWYLEYQEEQSDFIGSEVKTRAQDAKISLGKNVPRDLSYQVEDGHMEKVDERDGQDAYHLTLTGEEYVEEELIQQ